MMAENTKNNASEKNRQSMDDPHNLKKEDSIGDDSEVFYTGQECENINEKQRKERCRVAWDNTSDDMSPGRNNSISSVRSTDSGYASRKNTVNSIIYENEQNDVNFK